jgi:hypothetical protein
MRCSSPKKETETGFCRASRFVDGVGIGRGIVTVVSVFAIKTPKLFADSLRKVRLPVT